MSKTHKVSVITDVSSATSVQDITRLSGTDWEVLNVPARLEGSEETGGFSALVRSDTRTPLAFVSERFRATSHRRQLSVLSGLLEAGIITPAQVVSWDNGAVLAYQFRIPRMEALVAPGGSSAEHISTMLTMFFSHGYRMSDMTLLTGYRESSSSHMGRFCSLDGARVAHRGETNMLSASELSGHIDSLAAAAMDRRGLMNSMANKEMGPRALLDFVGYALGASDEDCDKAWVSAPEDLTGLSERIPQVLECWQNDECGAPGTVWQALNAVATYTTHVAGRNAPSRLRSALLGANSQVLARAWRAASEAV